MTRIVTFLSDFGTADPWVAAVKGVLHSVWARWPSNDPVPRIVDLSHDVPCGDIEAAAWFLEYATGEYPEGTVHLAVVDPGVGGERAALAIEAGGHFFVGPGNGLFHWLSKSGAELRLIRLDNPLYQHSGGIDQACSTFDGRDVFAPAAAHLAMGVPLPQIGSEVESSSIGSLPGQGFPAGSGGIRRTYRIRWVDHFGNAITDLHRDSDAGRVMDKGREVEVAGIRIAGPIKSYVHGEPGRPFWYWGSAGTLEIALRDASAAGTLGLQRGLALHVPGL